MKAFHTNNQSNANKYNFRANESASIFCLAKFRLVHWHGRGLDSGPNTGDEPTNHEMGEAEAGSLK